MARLFWICLGGAIGTGARYGLGGWVQRHAGTAFPWGTLAVNVLGSFLLGAIMEAGVASGSLSPTLKLALTAGVMGGFTTYSTFNDETLRYLRDGAWALGAANVAATVAICLLAGLAGMSAGRWAIGG